MAGMIGMTGMFGLTACPAPPEKSAPLPIEIERFRVDVAADDYAIGPETALVTIVVFSDYACGPCGRTWTTLQHLQEDYGDDLRVVHRSATVPGFTQGETAAEAVFAAGDQGKFWEMHWRLFAHPSDFSRPVLRAHAEALGLDMPRFMDDLDGGKFSGRRARDRRQATVLGIRALPVYFINGLFLLSAPKGEEQLRPIIDNELAMARKLIAEGTARKDVYAELMKTAIRERVGENDDARALRKRRAKELAERAGDPNVERRSPDPSKRYQVPVGRTAGAPALGPEDAPVVLVEFADYQCPFCRKNAASLRALRERYPEDLRIEARHLPLEIHPAAMGAARAAVAAGRQGKFWDFHERLHGDGGAFDYEFYVEYARELGMDVDRFKRDLQDPKVAEVVAQDVELARRLGVTATPGVFINGRYLEGLHGPEAYAELIDVDLAAAKELTASGTPRAELYDALMADALPKTQFANAVTRAAAPPDSPPVSKNLQPTPEKQD